jgi:hypothetical protein
MTMDEDTKPTGFAAVDAKAAEQNSSGAGAGGASHEGEAQAKGEEQAEGSSAAALPLEQSDADFGEERADNPDRQRERHIALKAKLVIIHGQISTAKRSNMHDQLCDGVLALVDLMLGDMD